MVALPPPPSDGAKQIAMPSFFRAAGLATMMLLSTWILGLAIGAVDQLWRMTVGVRFNAFPLVALGIWFVLQSALVAWDRSTGPIRAAVVVAVMMLAWFALFAIVAALVYGLMR